jgi:hypothetical protein
MLIVDTDSYLVYYGLPLTCVAWFAAVKVRAVMLLQTVLSVELALGVYFILHTYSPEVFTTNSLVMAGVVFAIAMGAVLAVYCGGAMVIYLACLTILVPVLEHNGQQLSDWLHLPSWGGIVLFVVLVVVLVAVVMLSSILSFVGLFIKVLVTSVTLVLLIRITHMENPPDMDDLYFTCDRANLKKYPGRCPVSITVAWVVGVLMVMLTQSVLIFNCNSTKKKKTKQQSQTKRGPPRNREPQNVQRVASPLYTAAAAADDQPGSDASSPSASAVKPEEESVAGGRDPADLALHREWEEWELVHASDESTTGDAEVDAFQAIASRGVCSLRRRSRRADPVATRRDSTDRQQLRIDDLYSDNL